MIKVYMFLIIMGILGAVGYGGYMYYKDTQQRIMTLKENNAKLEVAEQIANETINTMITDREKYTELNKELQGKLQARACYFHTPTCHEYDYYSMLFFTEINDLILGKMSIEKSIFQLGNISSKYMRTR